VIEYVPNCQSSGKFRVVELGRTGVFDAKAPIRHPSSHDVSAMRITDRAITLDLTVSSSHQTLVDLKIPVSIDLKTGAALNAHL